MVFPANVIRSVTVARFVLIEIPDNADADAFVSAVKNGAVIFGRPAPDAEVEVTQQEVVYGPLEGTKVEGLFGAPTKFCECPDYPGTSARSKTYGWYVHVKCGMQIGRAHV